MDVEIIEFYPVMERKNKSQKLGSFSVFLIDEKLDINGVIISGKKGNHWVGMPSGIGYHHETGKKVSYPFIKFFDQEKNKEFIEAVKLKAQDFLEKWFKKHPNTKKIAKFARY